ncbi:hypothetical protein P9112_012740 [Eukaryota sp. TZLM1-RC]
MSAGALQKAEAHYRDGLNAIKTSLFKWKPDHQSAAMAFERAATSFKVAKKMDKAIDAYRKSAASHAATGIHYSAGKNLETAASLAIKSSEIDLAVTLYDDAALQFGLDGNLNARINSFSRKADTLSLLGKASDAIECYMEAFELAMSEELTKRLIMDSTVLPLLAIYMAEKKYTKAAEFMKKVLQLHQDLKQPDNVCKDISSIILLYLAGGDYLAADKYFNDNCSLHGYMSTPDAMTVQQILDAYESRDEELIRNLAENDQGITFLMAPVSRTVSKLPITPLDQMDIVPKVVETLSLSADEDIKEEEHEEEKVVEEPSVDEIEEYQEPEVEVVDDSDSDVC